MGGKRSDDLIFIFSLMYSYPIIKLQVPLGKDEPKISSVIFIIVEWSFLAWTCFSLHSRISGSVNRLKPGNWLKGCNSLSKRAFYLFVLELFCMYRSSWYLVGVLSILSILLLKAPQLISQTLRFIDIRSLWTWICVRCLWKEAHAASNDSVLLLGTLRSN